MHEDTARALEALRHPVRTRVLEHLEAGPTTPKAIAKALGVRLENASYHIRILRDLEAIRLTGTRHVRGAVQHEYALTDLGRRALALAQLLEDPDGPVARRARGLAPIRPARMQVTA